jgi:hypothetical protein
MRVKARLIEKFMAAIAGKRWHGVGVGVGVCLGRIIWVDVVEERAGRREIYILKV